MNSSFGNALKRAIQSLSFFYALLVSFNQLAAWKLKSDIAYLIHHCHCDKDRAFTTKKKILARIINFGAECFIITPFPPSYRTAFIPGYTRYILIELGLSSYRYILVFLFLYTRPRYFSKLIKLQVWSLQKFIIL